MHLQRLRIEANSGRSRGGSEKESAWIESSVDCRKGFYSQNIIYAPSSLYFSSNAARCFLFVLKTLFHYFSISLHSFVFSHSIPHIYRDKLKSTVHLVFLPLFFNNNNNKVFKIKLHVLGDGWWFLCTKKGH